MKALLYFILAILIAPVALSAEEEIIDSVTVGKTTYLHVRVVEATPLDLLFAHDGGYKRLKLQDLAEPLKSKYPYDEAKAAEYKKKKAAEPQERAAQNAAAVKAVLLAREQTLQAKIEPMKTELKRLEGQIKTQHNIAKGKGKKSQEKKETDELREKKMDVQKQLWKLQDELQSVKEQRARYE